MYTECGVHENSHWAAKPLALHQLELTSRQLLHLFLLMFHPLIKGWIVSSCKYTSGIKAHEKLLYFNGFYSKISK